MAGFLMRREMVKWLVIIFVSCPLLKVFPIGLPSIGININPWLQYCITLLEQLKIAIRTTILIYEIHTPATQFNISRLPYRY